MKDFKAKCERQRLVVERVLSWQPPWIFYIKKVQVVGCGTFRPSFGTRYFKCISGHVLFQVIRIRRISKQDTFV